MASVPIRKLLRDHARTFGVTLRMLPRILREPLSVAYLLARASDTVADSRRIPLLHRVSVLEELERALDSGEYLSWQPKIRPEKLTASERDLISAFPDLIALLNKEEDRVELLRLWRTIVEGQLFDLRRFKYGASPLSREELEHYCWLVAGCVGETWTRLIARHAHVFGSMPDKGIETMRARGICYGKGLQLLNILRDRSEDRKQGRVYIQERDVPEMIEVASGWLDQGKAYCECLAPGRIRYATVIPLRLAVKTLDRIRKTPTAVRVKMPRWEVAVVLAGSLPSLVLPRRCNPAS